MRFVDDLTIFFDDLTIFFDDPTIFFEHHSDCNTTQDKSRVFAIKFKWPSKV